MEDLKKDLMRFSFLSAQSRIELWLTYKDLKPVSAFPAREDGDFVEWLQRTNIFYEKVPDSDLFAVSKEKERIQELLPIAFGNKKEEIEKKCVLYGYPAETALATYRNFAEQKDGLPVGVAVKKDNVFGITWWPYVRYVVREGHEHEDSLVAKRWSEEIKRDLPELDREFEELLTKIV